MKNTDIIKRTWEKYIEANQYIFDIDEEWAKALLNTIKAAGF